MKYLLSVFLCVCIYNSGFCQDSVRFTLKNQYQAEVKNKDVTVNGKVYRSGKKGELGVEPAATLAIDLPGYNAKAIAVKDMEPGNVIIVHKNFTWTDLLTPMFYIVLGGLWFIVFIIFAETGLFAGFFLPGDSLLFVTGIFSTELLKAGLGFNTNSAFFDIAILEIIISAAGILGNFVGYWFGKKAGPLLYDRKDTWLFKQRYLTQAREFYEKHGAGAIVIARFLPIIRTFAPIIAGIVGMDKKRFTFYNFIGCIAWVFTMLLAGHYLQQFFLKQFNFDLRDHLEVIVIGIVLVTTAPIIIRLFFGKKKKPADTDAKTA